MTNATVPALRAETDLNTEHSAGGISPSSESRPNRTPGVKANHRRRRGNDCVVRNPKSKVEDPREFQELHSALEYQPSGPSEDDTRGGRQQDTHNKPAPATESRTKNALIHGIYGKDILLPWESREDFEQLLADLQDEFQPRGRMENEIVFDVAHLRLQKTGCARCASLQLTPTPLYRIWPKPVKSRGQEYATT